ncbi:uncharacterized protein LOC122140673 [Cyprinus carpio]|uniref:Uncharacterized protein LOC122140673 n=1 Tax=Cyprinus carpio TaxID=7962 RepID=A0A9Q9XG37_CYPCA|nr:uncharacterized protein LOC122140673 [Cyprinus carpio]
MLKGAQDVIFNFKSSITCLDELDYAFNCNILSTEEVLPLCEVLKIKTPYQRVTVKAKVIQLQSRGHNFIRDGTFLQNTYYLIADETAAMDLTVWGESKITVDCWYEISNVSIRTFQDKQFLTTTKDTNFTIVTCQNPTHPVEENTTIQTVTAEIIGATIYILHICPQQHKITNMPLSASRVNCQKCDTFYRSSSITTYTHGSITINTTKGVQTLNIENHYIESIVSITHDSTTDHIIDTILALPPVNISIYKNNITNISLEDTRSTQTPKITITPPMDTSESLYGTDMENLMAEDFFTSTPSTSTATTTASPAIIPHTKSPTALRSRTSSNQKQSPQ